MVILDAGIAELTPIVGHAAACRYLGRSRAGHYRDLRPPLQGPSHSSQGRSMAPHGRLPRLPVRPVDEGTAAFAACVPYGLDAVRVELVDGSGTVAQVHDLAAPYLRPTTGGTQTRIPVEDLPAT